MNKVDIKSISLQKQAELFLRAWEAGSQFVTRENVLKLQKLAEKDIASLSLEFAEETGIDKENLEKLLTIHGLYRATGILEAISRKSVSPNPFKLSGISEEEFSILKEMAIEYKEVDTSKKT